MVTGDDVRRRNIDGDGQGDLAGHGGEHRAVFVYQIDSYRYWQAQLGRDDFTYGSSGRISPSRVWPTTGCASATATGSGRLRNCRNVGRLWWQGL
jgi:hypothetical protein